MTAVQKIAQGRLTLPLTPDVNNGHLNFYAAGL